LVLKEYSVGHAARPGFEETLVNEGVTYPPVPDQEQVWQSNAFQVQRGLAFLRYNTWLYDSAGGWNRFNDSGGAGTVTVDGVDYKTVNSANGIVTKVFYHRRLCSLAGRKHHSVDVHRM
jgi:hypothetical protein